MRKLFALLKAVYYFFTPYAHPFERRVDRVLSGIGEWQSAAVVRKRVESLMNENLAVMNLWLERSFKGYNYLKKEVRAQKYANLKLIEEDFKKFLKDDVETVPMEKKLAYMSRIMDYLKPGKRYKYQESTNFGELLRDPTKETLIGDCNQIVTLYAHLYALKYPVGDLKIKLPRGHICLHLLGVDIEATGGVFQHGPSEILPITELIATNLLDIHDFRRNRVRLAEQTLLKSAQLAYHLSSNRDLVNKNLRAARHNLALNLLSQKKWRRARKLFEINRDKEGVKSCYIAEYNSLAESVKAVKLLKDAVKCKSIYNKMLSLAKKFGGKGQVTDLKKLLDEISNYRR